MSDTYNGWENYETMNVAQWVENDEGLYSLAQEYRHRISPFIEFRDGLREIGVTETPDGVAYSDSGLDTDALDALITGDEDDEEESA